MNSEDFKLPEPRTLPLSFTIWPSILMWGMSAIMIALGVVGLCSGESVIGICATFFVGCADVVYGVLLMPGRSRSRCAQKKEDNK